MKESPKAPENLKEAGKAFWEKVHGDFILEHGHDLTRLEQACACLDTISDAEAVVREQGLFQTDRYGQVKPHCALNVIRDNRILFLRAVRELGLDLIEAPDSRLPGRY